MAAQAFQRFDLYCLSVIEHTLRITFVLLRECSDSYLLVEIRYHAVNLVAYLSLLGVYVNKKKIEKYLNIDQSLSKLHFWVEYKGCKVGKTSTTTTNVFRIRRLSKSYNAGLYFIIL